MDVVCTFPASVSEYSLFWQIVKDFLPAASPFVLLISVGLVWRTYRRSIMDVSPAAQIANVGPYLKDAYKNRKYPPGSAFARSVTTLSEARNEARSYLKPLNNTEEDKIFELFRGDTLREGHSDNKFAYQISLAVQEVGLMTFCGGIPLNYVLADHAITLIEDWVYCSELVSHIRSKHGEEESSNGKKLVSFSRRHGEWLALLAALYVWHRSGNIAQVRRFRNLCYPGKNEWSNLVDRANQIMDADKELLPSSVRRNARQILKLKRR